MLAIIKMYNWDSRRTARLSRDVEAGKRYVVQTNFGQFIGIPVAIKDAKEGNEAELQGIAEEIGSNGTELFLEIVREATSRDLEKLKERREKEKEAFSICRDKIKQYNLPMKLVGANYSLDGGNLIFAFTAENRVDFRELVRDLAHVFQKAVRLEQIGSRDEARICNGYGPCGRELCCSKFDGVLKSINTEMARMQQITHRGSDRISGCCGRLMCCLSYEIDHYEQLMRGMPAIGQTVKTRDGRGGVKSVKVLQQKVLVEFSKGESRWYKRSDVHEIK